MFLDFFSSEQINVLKIPFSNILNDCFSSITEDSQTVLVRRSVVWDTSPVKTKPQVIIHHDVDVVEGEDLSRCPPESRLGKDERKQLAGMYVYFSRY